MAGQTPRFALNFFGGDTAGTFDDDTQKYTSEDRLTLDRVLAALEGHDHRVPVTLDAPVSAPGLAVSATGGELDGGTTYSYVVSFINADGLETVAGPEASIATPDLLPVPDIPQGDTSTGGTLASGQYYYALSGLRGTEETSLSDPAAITLAGGDTQVTLTLPALGDATSYQVWRMKDIDPGWTRVGTSTTTTFVDTGAVPAGLFGDPANFTPAGSSGTSTYAITVSLTGADLTTVQGTSGWRVYRTTDSGIYGAASLVHDVIERTDDLVPTSPRLTEWFDDGDANLTGSPLLFSSQLMVPAFTFEQATGALPATTGYPYNYPILNSTGVLYINKAGTWTAIGGSGASGSYSGAWSSATTYPAGSTSTYSNGLWTNPASSLNQTPGSAGSPINVGYTGTSQNYLTAGQYGWGQQFQLTTGATFTSVQLDMNIGAHSGVVNVGVSTTANPSALIAGYFTGAISGSGIQTLTFASPLTLSAGTPYWFMVYASTNSVPDQPAGMSFSPASPVTTGMSVGNLLYAATYGNSLIDDGGDLPMWFQLQTLGPAPWTLVGYLVPPGGTTGQVLTKNSSTDGDYSWA